MSPDVRRNGTGLSDRNEEQLRRRAAHRGTRAHSPAREKCVSRGICSYAVSLIKSKRKGFSGAEAGTGRR